MLQTCHSFPHSFFFHHYIQLRQHLKLSPFFVYAIGVLLSFFLSLEHSNFQCFGSSQLWQFPSLGFVFLKLCLLLCLIFLNFITRASSSIFLFPFSFWQASFWCSCVVSLSSVTKNFSWLEIDFKKFS